MTENINETMERIIMDGATYECVEKFKHVLSGETLYRIKITFESGGVMYTAYTREQVIRTLGYKEYCKMLGIRKRKTRAVLMCGLDGTVVERFDSIKDAAKAFTRPTRAVKLGAMPENYTKLVNALKGHKNGIAYGYLWKYADQ